MMAEQEISPLSVLPRRLVRPFYALEFLVAIIAVFSVWSQVGGQGHLDLMPWYWKLSLGAGCAIAIVKVTAAASERDRPWHSRTLKWMAILLVLVLGCGLITYYYHLYEPQDEEDEQGVTSLRPAVAAY